jgi:molecular chaperone DnaK
LSLGIETLDGAMTKLIARNTTIPTSTKRTFSTTEDYQTAVTVKVYMGEQPTAAANHLLAVFEFGNIAPRPLGVAQVEATFDIDNDGILHVSAEDLCTGKQLTVRVVCYSGGLSLDKIREELSRAATEGS